MVEENKFDAIKEDLPEDLVEDDRPEEDEIEGAPVYFEEPPADCTVIGVRFRTSAKVYYFDPDGKDYPEGCHAIVETARGQEYGAVVQGNHVVPGREIVQPLRKALRVATPADDAHDLDNRKRAEDAFAVGCRKIEEHKLDMKLIDTEFTFDNGKLLFYFTSDGRVDFRELVKDLASVFRCRIELRQMGIRDEAKILGGLGICGRPFCCHAFLPDFVQVSIKMAKEQNLALNAAKISGTCGRLMCCLRYEYDAYLEEGRLTPKVDTMVNTPDGIGVVIESKPLVGLVKVRSLGDSASAPRVYHRDQLTPIRKGDENYERALEEKTLEKQARAAGTTRAALKAAMNMTPEQAAEKQARAQRLQQRTRPDPPRAASYTGQVLPSALEAGSKSRLDIPFDDGDDDFAVKETGSADRRSSRDRKNGAKKHGRSQHGRRDAEKPQTPEGERVPARRENGASSHPGQKNEHKQRYERIPRNDGNKNTPRDPAVPAPPAAPAAPGAAEAPSPAANEQQKKTHRPFRRFKKR